MEAQDLFGLPLGRFVGERTALAKELRSNGERDQATQVETLRKPTLAAWAVNQLVRTQKRDVKALFKAGDKARRSQADLLAGRGTGAALRTALDQERAAVSGLLGAARGLLSSEGHELSPAILERVAETLHAAALDEDARAQVVDGCLQRELRNVGIGAAGLTAEPARPRTARARRRADTTALMRAEAKAQKAAERATRVRAAAIAKRESAADALSRADEAVAEAEKQVSAAEAAHRRARRDLDKAKRTG